MPDGLEAAWDRLHEALPARWCVGLPSFDPGALRSDGYRGAWSVTARGPHPGRGRVPATVRGIGETEEAALRALDDRLRGVPQPHGSNLDGMRRRLRLAYVEGAESWAVENIGRSLTGDELERVIGRYAGR